MYIDGWGTNLRFSSAHFIPGLGKCSRLHGHDYAVSLELEGDIINGIVVDYGDVKKIARKVLEYYDHRVLIPESSGHTKVEVIGNAVNVQYEGKKLTFHGDDVAFINSEFSTSENLSMNICEKIKAELKVYRNLKSLTVTVFEGPSQGSSFRVDL